MAYRGRIQNGIQLLFCVSSLFSSPVPQGRDVYKRQCKGRLKSDGQATLTLTGVKGGKLYIDGVMYKGDVAGVKLPAGEHSIEYTAKEPVPMPTTIEDVVYAKAGNMVYLLSLIHI